ncbi:MAG: hypothetical protein ABI036_02560 [Fibrobacteria bacterium]
MNSRLLPLLIFCVLVSHPAHAAIPGLKPDGHLDLAILRTAYFDGDFGKVRAALDGFLKKHPKDVTRDEKIFTHEHLGIFCAADPNTQARAERHFLALMQLSPEAGIGDLLVPPGTLDLFERIRRDYFERQANSAPHPASASVANASTDPSAGPASPSVAASAGASLAAATTPNPPMGAGTAYGGNSPEEFDTMSADSPSQDAAWKESGHAWVWWTVGSAAVAAAGMGVYALVAPDASPAPRRAIADGTLK